MDHFTILRENRKIILDRILLSFGLNPLDIYYPVSMETFIKFIKIFITREASIEESIELLENVFLINLFCSFLNWVKINWRLNS